MFACLLRCPGYLLLCFTVIASAQGTHSAAGSPAAASLRYVMPAGPGDIVPPHMGWQVDTLSLLDGGTRLAVQLKQEDTGLVASYLLFPNQTGAATSVSCRSAVLAPILSSLKESAVVREESSSTRKIADGHMLAIAAYRIEKAGDVPLQQQNVFGFFGDKQTCFEIHLSKASYKDPDKATFDRALDAFAFDPDYMPKAADYGLVATLFFNYLHDFKSAATYYQRAFRTLPTAEVTSPSATVLGRVTVVQLAMSYGLSGDLQRSRAVDEAAILRDPQYPLPYYNLACADAEGGDAAAAKTHLQQAFDRRRFMLPGLSLPDPTEDDSFLKLKNDAAFWNFVQALPKS